MCLYIDYIWGSRHPYGNEISEDRLWMFPSVPQKQRDDPLEPLDTFDIQTLREPERVIPSLSSLTCCVCLCCSVMELFMSELLLK